MRYFLILWFCLSSFIIYGQFGLRMSYGVSNTDKWNDEYQKLNVNEGKFLNSSLELGADYWFRMKNIRLEFLPMLYISIDRHTTNNIQGLRTLSKGSIGAKFNTYIYPFDFFGDCDCPTFSKQGNLFTKGFYFNLAPGIGYNRFITTFQEDSPPTEFLQERSNDINYVLGLGVGLDIGINDLLTISPFFQYDYYSNVEWEDFNSIISSSEDTNNNITNHTKFHAGVRIGIRSDYERGKRRR